MKKRSSESKAEKGKTKAKSSASPGPWVKSKISAAHIDILRQEGTLPSGWRRPGDEEIPRPQAGERVMHFDVVRRGVSFPIHPFLRGLLCEYGAQLHHFTPNSLLIVSCFATLCECWLGVFPHWGLFRRVFVLRKQATEKSKSISAIGGIGIQARPDVEFFNFRLLASVRGWREKWFYAQDQCSETQRFGLAEFSVAPPCKRKSWDHEMTEAEMLEANRLLERVSALRSSDGLTGVDIMLTWLRRRVQPLRARAEPMWTYSGAGDLTRATAEEFSSVELRAHVKALTHQSAEELEACIRDPPTPPFSADNPLPEVCSLTLI